jgi:hypothetical protein
VEKALGIEVPFEPSEEGLVLGTGTAKGLKPTSDFVIERSAYVGYPSLTLDGSGRPVIAWVHEEGRGNSVLTRLFDPQDETWSNPLEFAPKSGDAWLAYQPQVVATREGILCVWTETSGGRWRILARVLNPQDNSLGPVQPIASSDQSGFVAWRPSVTALPDGSALVAWEEKPESRAPFSVRVRGVDREGRVTDRQWGTEGADGDCCRPSLALAPDGKRAGLVFDRYHGKGTTQVHMVFLSAPACQPLGARQITYHPATDLAPDIAFSPEGRRVWVGWHSNREGKDRWDIPRWFRMRAYDIERDALLDPAWPPPSLDLGKQYTDQGFEFARIACAANEAVCVLGRPSHRFCLQYYHGDAWSPLYRFPVEGWGGRGQYAKAQFDSQGRLWVVRRDVGANFLERIDGIADTPKATPKLNPYTPPSPTAVPVLANLDNHYEFPVVEAGKAEDANSEPESWNIYFGDIHGHTWMSDGMGDVDEVFRRARDIFQDDFHALTDHDNFVQQKYLHAEYEEQKSLVDHFYEPGRFVTLYAQEWTTPRTGRPHGYGHKNLFSITPDHPLFDHLDESTRDTPDLFAALKRHGMIAIPHHIGWTGVDWENHDPEIQPLAEICSVHGVFEYMGNMPIPHRGARPGQFVQDGLNRGLRFGLVGGSDQHGLVWHHGVCWKRNAYRAGLTGVLAKELTREAIFDAMKKRRTFAATGVKLRPVLTVAGLTMGEEGTVGEPPLVSVDVLALGQIRWITVVRNGQDLVRYGGENKRSRFSFTDDSIPENQTSYYYLRVELEDGNMAWTSPIWVTPTA